MQITYSKSALKDLRKMPGKDAKAITAKLAKYAETGEGDVKKLQGRPEYRLRHGNWRALFEINGDVIVIRVAARGNIY